MHMGLAFVALLVVAFPSAAAAQGGRGGGPPAAARPVAGNGVEVPGWWARLDDPKEARTGLRVTASGSGVHIVTGPNAIFFDPQVGGDDEYTVRARFSQNKPASHQVAYGLFIGGNDLDLDKQRYTYFVIRQDGRFLIRKRNGAATSNVAGDWTEHPAIVKADASGKQVNELSITVAKDMVTFLANGQVVATHPIAAIDTEGIAGVRVGHGLDLQIDNLGATRPGESRTN